MTANSRRHSLEHHEARTHRRQVVAEASHSAPGRAVTADPAVLAARTIAGVDIGAARRAAADFLSALGIDVDREEMRETPARMARAYAELFSTRPLRLTTCANDEGYDELVLARAIPFRTVCEHHLLPLLRPGARRPTAPRPLRLLCWARYGPTRAAERSSSPWPACRAEHNLAAVP